MAANAQSFSGIAGRYAEALFDLAKDASALDEAERDFKTLHVMVQGSADFRGFLTSPVYNAEEKANAMSAIVDKAGVSTLVSNFLGLVARNGRLFALEGIMGAFFARLADHRGEVTAEAVSAAPLSEDQEKRLRGEIERHVGKAVNLNTSVDPDLLGGVVVKVGSTMIDGSLKTKLSRLKSKLKEA